MRKPSKRELKKRIAEEWLDSDGYWIALKGGWQDSFNPTCHTIVEDTKAEAYKVLACSEPCNCAECISDLKNG